MRELIAACGNTHWNEDGADDGCPGELRFRWGMTQAECDTCGAWCGIAVADWSRVEINR